MTMLPDGIVTTAPVDEYDTEYAFVPSRVGVNWPKLPVGVLDVPITV